MEKSVVEQFLIYLEQHGPVKGEGLYALVIPCANAITMNLIAVALAYLGSIKMAQRNCVALSPKSLSPYDLNTLKSTYQGAIEVPAAVNGVPIEQFMKGVKDDAQAQTTITKIPA